MSRLKARMSRSKSPMFAAWKSSGWSSMDKAILRAAQMFPDITWWACWRLRLFLWRLKAVRKLLAASLGKQQEKESVWLRSLLPGLWEPPTGCTSNNMQEGKEIHSLATHHHINTIWYEESKVNPHGRTPRGLKHHTQGLHTEVTRLTRAPCYVLLLVCELK